MKPIEDRADVTYMEALRCVQYRVPALGAMTRPSYLVALGLRYGLIGVSASHHLLLASEASEESDVVAFMRSWPHMVEDHLRLDLAPKLPVMPCEEVYSKVSYLAHQPLRHYMSMWRQGVPLERCLEVIVRRFDREHEAIVRRPWFWPRRGRADADFRDAAQSSILYALHFFERREAGLDEVSEIALLGE